MHKCVLAWRKPVLLISLSNSSNHAIAALLSNFCILMGMCSDVSASVRTPQLAGKPSEVDLKRCILTWLCPCPPRRPRVLPAELAVWLEGFQA